VTVRCSGTRSVGPPPICEWVYARPYYSNQQRLDALLPWLHDYNHYRPHRALDGRSPMQLLNNLPGSRS
jgi:transposase InsO family protein